MTRTHKYYDAYGNFLREEQEEYTPSSVGPPKNPIEELEAENKLLKARLQAQTERSDFIEDCIAEMATMVYGDV